MEVKYFWKGDGSALTKQGRKENEVHQMHLSF